MDPLFGELYGGESISSQRGRYVEALDRFEEKFGDVPAAVFSTSGRTELSGNHTDHNHGRVLAAGIQLDKIAVASPRADSGVEVWTDGYEKPIRIDLNRLDPVASETGSAPSLARGVAARLHAIGRNIGGFNAYVMSDVAMGSGLSSSASFEVLLGTILDHLYGAGDTDPVVLAQVGQYAENVYFGKPCGLMDQVACAVGGIVSIDFRDPKEPMIDRVGFDFESLGYALTVIDTGGNHADLTPDYAAVPAEMKSLAAALGKSVCRDLTVADILNSVTALREKTGDRAILRGLHFIAENDRVGSQVDALKRGDLEVYLGLVKESGDSSWKLLQNVYPPANPSEQGVTLALAVSAAILHGRGACRVHGGGFAGTVQAYVPVDFYRDYAETLEGIFGAGSVTRLRIRQSGTRRIN